MMLSRQLRRALGQLRPLAVRDYADARGWQAVPLEGRRFWLFRHPEKRLRQLQIPIDSDDPGFVDAMFDVVERLVELEARPIEAVLDDLQAAHADVLRFRVANGESADGQIPLDADLQLREGARKALLASACSVVNPAPFHPRLSRGEADALLAACRAGQTEVGSYVVKIICPLHASPGDGDSRHEGLEPFTRRVTSHLMRTLAELVCRIERDEVNRYGEDEQYSLSWNLCDALLLMHSQRSGSLELSTTWARLRRPPRDPSPRRTHESDRSPTLDPAHRSRSWLTLDRRGVATRARPRCRAAVRSSGPRPWRSVPARTRRRSPQPCRSAP